MKLIFKNL